MKHCRERSPCAARLREDLRAPLSGCRSQLPSSVISCLILADCTIDGMAPHHQINASRRLPFTKTQHRCFFLRRPTCQLHNDANQNLLPGYIKQHEACGHTPATTFFVVLMKSAHSAHIKTSATPLRSSTLIVHSTMGRAPQDPLLVAAPADTASARSRSRPAVASNRPAWPLNWRNSALSSSCSCHGKSCSAVFSPWSSEIPDRGGGGGAAMAAARLRARAGPLGSSRHFFIQAGQASGQRTCLGFHGCHIVSCFS